MNRLLDLGFWRYALSGLTGRGQARRACPACRHGSAAVVDRKLFHAMLECVRCGLLYRHPRESAQTMNEYYQSHYAAPDMTTELPTPEELGRLMATGFKGSVKDFSYHIEIMRALGLQPGQRVLDYGANWGYLTYQLGKAGYVADGFEISKPRAGYAQHLGVNVVTSLDQLPGDYDMCYSCHVLEHVSDPLRSLKEQLAKVRTGGLVLVHTPNGSAALRRQSPRLFHAVWGRSHPVLLSDRFVTSNFAAHAYYVSSDDRPALLETWDQRAQVVGDTSGSAGLFIALVR